MQCEECLQVGLAYLVAYVHATPFYNEVQASFWMLTSKTHSFNKDLKQVMLVSSNRLLFACLHVGLIVSTKTSKKHAMLVSLNIPTLF